jgi:hypothetical protein
MMREERSEPRGLSTTSRDSVREHNLQQNQSPRPCLNKPKVNCFRIILIYVNFGAGSNNHRLKLTTTEMICTLLHIQRNFRHYRLRLCYTHKRRMSKFAQSLLPQFLTRTFLLRTFFCTLTVCNPGLLETSLLDTTP